MAYTFYYEDAERTDGTLYTRKLRHFIGRVGDGGMSNLAARREHDRIMQTVNQKRGSVAPTIHGKTFLDAVNAWRRAIAPALSPATVRGMESHLKIQTIGSPMHPVCYSRTVRAQSRLNRDNLVKYVLKPILKKLGIPAHETGLHAFRHGLATELANASVPLPVLQRQMRHADVRTRLRIYSHLVSETHVDVMERLAQRSISTVVPISTEVGA